MRWNLFTCIILKNLAAGNHGCQAASWLEYTARQRSGIQIPDCGVEGQFVYGPDSMGTGTGCGAPVRESPAEIVRDSPAAAGGCPNRTFAKTGFAYWAVT